MVTIYYNNLGVEARLFCQSCKSFPARVFPPLGFAMGDRAFQA